VTAVERLDEIEAWAQELEDASSGSPEQFEAAENISDLIAALRAVLALAAHDSWAADEVARRFPELGRPESWGDGVEAAITAALAVTS